MKVAGYIRVSTPEQKEEKSHIRQKEYLKRWAENEGHDIDFFMDIAVSGQDKDRKEYQRLKEQAQNYDLIVARELSRLGRSLKQVITDIEYFDKVGTPVILLKDNIDLSSAYGRLFFHIIGAINQFEADIAREFTIEKIRYMRKEGEHVGRPFKLPEDKRKKALEYHEKGVSCADIGRILGVSRDTAKRYVEEFEKN